MTSSEIRPELRKAVALLYDGKTAPHVTAKGSGDEAAEILRLAQEHNIPTCDNPALAEVLSHIDLGDEIPKPLYIAVAQIIAFAHRIRLLDLPGQANEAIPPQSIKAPRPPEL